MHNSDLKLITTGSTEGQQLNIAGGQYRIIVSGEQTNGSFAVIEMTVPPGAGPVPHAHPAIEESFYILEGKVRFTSEAGEYIAGKGALVSIPKGGIVHHFKNQSDQPAKLLCTVIPAGLDAFFVEAATTMETLKGQTSEATIKEEMKRISEKYGQQLLPPDYFGG